MNLKFIWVCSAEPTLSYGRRVGAVGQLIGLQAWHSRRRETTGDEVVKSHQLIGSGLLPPPGSSIAEPHLRGQQRQKCIIYLLTQTDKLKMHTACTILFFICQCAWSMQMYMHACVCVRPLWPIKGHWTDRDLNIWIVQWNHRHYIFVCYCKSQGSDNAGGQIELLKPILVHYLNEPSILRSFHSPFCRVWHK